MMASSSSNTANLFTESVVDNVTKIGSVSGGGRKSSDVVAGLMEVSSDERSSNDASLEDVVEDYDAEEEDSDEESEEEEFDEEQEEEERERTLILEDMMQLKKLADFFQHPQKPVEVDGFAAGRSYFSRFDAPEVVSEDEDEELAQALADARALKQVAAAYLHPERPVGVDATACARNYFSQPWAAEQETFGQAEERARLVGESMQLKEHAVTYRHPEAPVDMERATAMGRNYFQRASAPEQMDEEQAVILEEMKALKQLAVDYLHPERPVVVDAAATGRNYFMRASAPEQEEDECSDEREIILEEMKELKQLAVTFMHPEKPVEIDPTATGRNYFMRASAPQQEEDEYADEREIVLEEMKELKQLAVTFMHPEKPVEIDSTATGRNYFMRASAPEQEEDEYSDEREIVLEEMKELKQSATDFMHPEKPVEMDSFCARSYFSRPSAPEDVDAEERELILQEMQALKQLAVTYMHPEKPVEMDPTASGRNYFMRASAPEQEADEYSDDRAIVLEEMKELKELAVTFMHPEKPVEIDPTATGRNYFSRASAPDQEEDEYTDEREIVLEEMRELKQSATDFMHPEKPVEMDGTCARSYFSRPAALEQDEDAEERELILQEMQALKSLAIDFMHPERPVEVDPATSGRNYFSRPSASEQEDINEERDLVLQEMQSLKKLAVDYMHPEKPVVVDVTACARSYFSRPSAAEYEDEDEAEEREKIFKEVAMMKKTVVDFMHPELPVSVEATAFGRNYYGRASAVDIESFAEAEERALVISEAAKLKESAVDYLHPENPVDVSPAVFGRNYFSRSSADDSGSEDEEERTKVLEEAAQLKKLASDYLHPERAVVVDPCAFGRNFFGRASAADQEDDELDAECQDILEDLAALKKLAVDYLHPEAPVSVDPTAFGRNYFGRASAATEESFDEAEERVKVLAEAAGLKKLAANYAHPELPVVADASACARSYFSRASAPQQESTEEAEERALVMAEASALKRLASDYHHPEVGVQTTDATACGRNYFVRASASGVAEHISTSGHANEEHAHVEEHSQYEDYGHFEMDEEMFYDMRQSIVLPLPGDSGMGYSKIQSSKMSSEEEGELSRSPSSVMLFTGALEDAGHPPLPSMG